MSQRTNIAAVQKILATNYDGKADVQPYIDSAIVIVDRVAVSAANKNIALLATELELIERWLAAYFYCKMDPLYQTKGTSKASATFVGSQSLDAEQERYKRGAIELDYSGSLNAILNRKTAGGFWLGKPASAQIPYDQRD